MSGYIGNTPVPQATQTRDVFTATSGQTSFATSGYTPGYVDVWLNGVKLVDGSDFTASNGSDVVLTSGATAGDTLEVLSYSTYEVNNQAFTGDFSVDGTTFKVDSTNNRVGIGTATPDSPFVLSGTNVRQKITDGTNTLSMGQFDGLTNQIGSAGRDLYLLTSGANSVKFGTNNTERMNLDSSGRLTLPYQPSFQAYLPTSPSTHDATGDTAVISDRFTQTFHNIGGHYNTSTGRFTAPVAGRYFFAANVRWETQDFVQTAYIRLVIAKNSTGFASTELNQINGNNEAWANYMGMSVCGVLQLAAGDYVQLVGGMSGGTAKFHREGSFSGHLIG